MHPFQLSPLFKPKPWGGRRLESLGKLLPEGPIGESWEVADLPASIASSGRSLVLDGPHRDRSLRELIDSEPGALLGSAPPWRDGNFPLLIKLLDAAEHLSVQVHPDEGYAARHPSVHTKSESWYVLAAEPGSVIFSGVRDGVTHSDLAQAAGSADIIPLLRTVPAVVGELHDIPAGTIHALGAGVLAAEIQTPSDTTFRLYDWTEEYRRPSRTLHLAAALETADLNSRPEPTKPTTSGWRRLITTPYYVIDEQRAATAHVGQGSLAVVMVVAGHATVAGNRYAAGGTVVVPASAGPIEIDAGDGITLIVSLVESDPHPTEDVR